jgi:hypothetical protein
MVFCFVGVEWRAWLICESAKRTHLRRVHCGDWFEDDHGGCTQHSLGKTGLGWLVSVSDLAGVVWQFIRGVNTGARSKWFSDGDLLRPRTKRVCDMEVMKNR